MRAFWADWRLVDYDGLSTEEIVGRLLILTVLGGLPAFIIMAFAPRTYGSEPWAQALSYGSSLLLIAVVWRDASHAHIRHPWAWALLAGIVPLLGWWLYARRRARTNADSAGDGSLSATQHQYVATDRTDLARMFNPFWRARYTLYTGLSPEACRDRLRAALVSSGAPSTWFATQSARPIQGSVSTQRFAIKRRHFMTRPMLLTEAASRVVAKDGGSRLDVTIGVSRSDAAFMIFWLGFTGILGLIFAWTTITSPGSWYPSPPPLLSFLLLPLGGMAVCAMVRWIGRGDDQFLFDFLVRTLEAEEHSS